MNRRKATSKKDNEFIEYCRGFHDGVSSSEKGVALYSEPYLRGYNEGCEVKQGAISKERKRLNLNENVWWHPRIGFMGEYV